MLRPAIAPTSIAWCFLLGSRTWGRRPVAFEPGNGRDSVSCSAGTASVSLGIDRRMAGMVLSVPRGIRGNPGGRGRDGMKVRDVLTLDVEDVALGGKALARVDGRVVFVDRGLPGDRVLARVTKANARFSDARFSSLARARARALRARGSLRRLPAPGAAVRGPGALEGAPGARGAPPHRRFRGPPGARER